MASFASFVSTDSFDFSADYQFGPITKDDLEVWRAFYRAREKPSRFEKKLYVRNWLAENEAFWKGSSLRVNHERHKHERAVQYAAKHGLPLAAVGLPDSTSTSTSELHRREDEQLPATAEPTPSTSTLTSEPRRSGRLASSSSLALQKESAPGLLRKSIRKSKRGKRGAAPGK